MPSPRGKRRAGPSRAPHRGIGAVSAAGRPRGVRRSDAPFGTPYTRGAGLAGQAPLGGGIIHLGATSCFVTDNGDLLIVQEALALLRRRLQDVIAALAGFAAQWQDQPTLGFTHFQPAQPTTVGKRASLWIQDLLLDLEDLDHLIHTTPVRGVKGTTGTQASFLELFEGDGDKVEALERRFCAKVGFPAIPVSGQTATRKLEDRIGQVLCGIAASAWATRAETWPWWPGSTSPASSQA